MDMDVALFFAGAPETLTLYGAVAGWMGAEFEQVSVKVQKTQITFSNRYGFACISLPRGRAKSGGACIVVSFGLGYKLEEERIAWQAEPYPGRFTHHVLLTSAGDVDDKLKGWLREAYHFSMGKR